MPRGKFNCIKSFLLLKIGVIWIFLQFTEKRKQLSFLTVGEPVAIIDEKIFIKSKRRRR